MTKKNLWIGLTLGVLGAVLFSGKAIIIKLAYRHGADATTLIALRMLVALPFFVVTAWYTRQGEPGQPSPWRKGDAWRIIALGLLGYYAASYLDFLGLKYISAGLERVILYLSPTVVLLLSVIYLRKKIGAVEYLALAVSYCGVLFVFWHDVSLASDNTALGAALVFAAAICYAVYLTAGGEMVRRLGSIRMTSWASLVSCIACISQGLLVDANALLTQQLPVYGLSVFNGVFCTVLPVFMTMMAVERVGSTVASQTSMLGPISTVFFAAWFLQEPITAYQMIGTVTVVAGVFILTMKKTG